MAVNLGVWFTFPGFGEASQGKFARNLEVLQSKSFHHPDGLDFESFRSVDEDRTLRSLETFFRIGFRQGSRTFNSDAWIRLFRINEPVVREFVYEFLVSVKFIDITSSLNTAHTLVFQLGGVKRSMTLREFTLALGLYMEREMNNPLFDQFRGQCIRKRPNTFNPSSYVSQLTHNHGYDPKHPPSYTTIRSPLRHLVHRLISCSVTARHFGKEKVTVDDLFFLRSMDGGACVDLPWHVANFLVEKAKGAKTNSMICGAHLISRLARYFGLMNDHILGNLVVENRMTIINARKLVDLGICEYDVLGKFRMVQTQEVSESEEESDDDDDEEEQVQGEGTQGGVVRRPNMTFTNRLTAMDGTLFDLGNQVEEIAYTVSGMSEQYDQFYGEFRGYRDEQQRFNTWQADHLSMLLENSHISHTRYNNTVYTYVPVIPDIGVHQEVSFVNQDTPEFLTPNASTPSMEPFAPFGDHGARPSHMDE